MSLSYNFKTWRSGSSYESRTQSEMSALGDEKTGEVETGINEGSEEISIGCSPALVDEKIKASLEPLHAQISALTEMMDHLIRSNSAKEAITASSRGTPHQYESPYNEEPGSFRFPTVAPRTSAGYSHVTDFGYSCLVSNSQSMAEKWSTPGIHPLHSLYSAAVINGFRYVIDWLLLQTHGASYWSDYVQEVLTSWHSFVILLRDVQFQVILLWQSLATCQCFTEILSHGAPAFLKNGHKNVILSLLNNYRYSHCLVK